MHGGQDSDATLGINVSNKNKSKNTINRELNVLYKLISNDINANNELTNDVHDNELKVNSNKNEKEIKNL